MLHSVGAEWVIIGHSERREYFGETDAIVHEKTKTVLAASLKPIFCCGEPLAIREGGDYLNYVKVQLTHGLFAFSAEDFSKIVIAYEPIWAIGTGLTASPEQAQEMHAALRAHIAAHYGQEIADNTSLLYGGSVKASNAKELFGCADVDGGLVGGAALQSREFTEIVKAI
jgi:triosephosphate isomerase